MEDNHFVHRPELDVLHHRPDRTLRTCFNAVLATAVFRIWPHLLFLGAWSTGIILINDRTSAELSIPPTLLTVLGVLLGLTLSYRTSSAYERYWEGRRMWSQIVFGCRWWARSVWIHGPNSLVETPNEEWTPEEAERDLVKATLEKKTMVNMALGFAIAVKHYLRGEEGILYEDLYDLVKFVPGLNLPSGMPPKNEAYEQPIHASSPDSIDGSDSKFGTTSSSAQILSSNPPPATAPTWRPVLAPARDPPVFRWSETFPIRYFVMERQRIKREEREARAREGKRARKERARAGGHGQNIPCEIALFMSSYVNALQKRKSADIATVNAMFLPLQQLNDALASLERILTTPIPFSYAAHIWEVTWIYVLILPFQLYNAGFGWVTVPATMVTAYILIGFVSIGEGEVMMMSAANLRNRAENPFGYNKNDLNLDFFTSQIIKPELEAITANPWPGVEDWIFSGENDAVFGSVGIGADKLQNQSMSSIRQRLGANKRPIDVLGGQARRSLAQSRKSDV